jgi:D-3-phosphoglycerate dehydrogenase
VSETIIQVTTHPFGACGDRPRRVLEGLGGEVRYNPYGRRLKPHEVADLVGDCHGVVAGTEPYTREVIEGAPDLKVIARVGVGFDNVDFEACRERGVLVTFTPEAPADAVAELTVCQIINLLRKVHDSDKSVREGAWNRYLGHLVREVKIGVLGVGRIGKRVVRLLQPFQPQVFGCDLAPDLEFGRQYNVTWMSRDELFRTCDLVTVHVPFNEMNRGLVGYEQLQAMPRGGYVINASRGKIVDEKALVEGLSWRHLGGAAIDVFENEPYDGPLTRFDNVVLTAHMGASARRSRFLMELGAAEDCVRVLSGQAPLSPVTDEDRGLTALPLEYSTTGYPGNEDR